MFVICKRTISMAHFKTNGQSNLNTLLTIGTMNQWRLYFMQWLSLDAAQSLCHKHKHTVKGLNDIGKLYGQTDVANILFKTHNAISLDGCASQWDFGSTLKNIIITCDIWKLSTYP